MEGPEGEFIVPQDTNANLPNFTQVSRVRKWIYQNHRFTKANQALLTKFFDTKPFFAHGWDIYHYETSSSDFFLLKVDDVLQFFETIHKATGVVKHLHKVPPKQLSLRIEPNTLPPELLGRVVAKDEFDRLVKEYAWDPADNPTKKKNDKAKQARKQSEKKRILAVTRRSQVRTARQLLRLGNHADPAHERDDEPIVPQDIVLASVDVEAYERDHNCITEIGVSILDTADIPPKDKLPPLSLGDLNFDDYEDPAAAPRTRADAICDLIKSRHFRIYEHRFLRNGEFVTDAADRFDFGESEWVKLDDIPGAINSSLRFFDGKGNKRKLILIGHDIKQDVSYLRNVGYDVWKIEDLEVMDTEVMYKGVKRMDESRSLGKVLADVNVAYCNLHNAGNDAAYTLQALVRLADIGVRKREDDDDDFDTAPIDPSYEDLVEAGNITYHPSADGPEKKLSKKAAKLERAKKAEEKAARAEEMRMLKEIWKQPYEYVPSPGDTW